MSPHKPGERKKSIQVERQNPPSQPEEAKESVATIRKQANAQNTQQNPAASTPTVVSLEPLAPIIVGTGRPFVANSAQFPPPSTVAGCLRTAWARETGTPFEPTLAKISVAGPLLLNCDNGVLVPKPADALYFRRDNTAVCVRTEPRQFDVGDADLPDDLLPVQLTEQIIGKPGDGPAWWSWDDLIAFRKGESVDHADLCQNGWTPTVDRRTHVAINPCTGTADAGKLFQTEGTDFAVKPHDTSAMSLRLLVRFEKELGATLVHLGGERRLAALRLEEEATWPEPPQGWLDDIRNAGGLCLTLLTPGVFSAGYRPGWLNPNLRGSPPTAPNLQLELRAAAIDRWQPYSGWDLANQRPRPTRKLAGAGATYWFRIAGGDGDLEALWLASVSDHPQDRLDGFGLALPGPWEPI